MSWSDGIDYEVKFWDKWFETKGDRWPEDYAARLVMDRPVPASFVQLLDESPANPVRVLDVGAGPLTVFGWIHPRKSIELQATDALAKEYDRLLLKHGVTPPIRTMFAPAEKLTDYFATNMFDFVFAQNCIDHCASPYMAICQMLAVAKIGAPVHLGHAENEGENEGYTGFHQWNFSAVDGKFIIRGKNETLNLSDLVRPFAVTEASVANKWVNVLFRKTHDVPAQYLVSNKP